MKILTKKKVVIYTTANLILFITNMILFAFTMNNPLTVTWLMVVYFVLSSLVIAYLLYILIRAIGYDEKIPKVSKRYKVFDWAGFILIPFSLFILIFGNFFVRGKVSQNSMIPTLYDGDVIFIYKFQYEPKTGDIAIIKESSVSDEEGDFIIKRIIAVPGDIIRFHEHGYVDGVMKGQVFINDEAYVSPSNELTGVSTLFTFAEFTTLINGQELISDQTYKLKEGKYLALGDNFMNSKDSRNYGAFDIAQIGGKMVLSLGGGKK